LQLRRQTSALLSIQKELFVHWELYRLAGEKKSSLQSKGTKRFPRYQAKIGTLTSLLAYERLRVVVRVAPVAGAQGVAAQGQGAGTRAGDTGRHGAAAQGDRPS
jgi:hypothetical protein